MVYMVSRTIDALDLATPPSFTHLWNSYRIHWQRTPPSDDEGQEKLHEVIRKSLPKSYRPPKEGK